MKKVLGTTFLALSLPLLVTANSEVPKEVINKGKNATQMLIKTLGSNMKKNLKAGGAMQALDFCSQEAYTLTQSVNEKLPKGVEVKRVSLKNRSPLNTAKQDEMKVLLELHALQKQNKKLPNFVVKQIDEHTYKFYKPLVINKGVCLKCHGDIQNEKLANEIAKRYPDDKATGYKMGDLRGAVVTTIHQ